MNTSPSTLVTLNVLPSVGLLIDDTVHITITGLDPRGQKVTVFASVIEEGNKFVSCGHYECDHEGVVDMEKTESTGGTYTGRCLHWFQASSLTVSWPSVVTFPFAFISSFSKIAISECSYRLASRNCVILAASFIDRNGHVRDGVMSTSLGRVWFTQSPTPRGI